MDVPTLKLDIINGRSLKFMVGFSDRTLFSITNSTQFLILNDLFKIQFHPEPFQPGDRYPEVSEHGAYLWFALLSHARET